MTGTIVNETAGGQRAMRDKLDGRLDEVTGTAPTLKDVARAQSRQLLILQSLLFGANAMIEAAGDAEIQMLLDVALEKLDAIHDAFQPHI